MSVDDEAKQQAREAAERIERIEKEPTQDVEQFEHLKDKLHEAEKTIRNDVLGSDD
jgi:hypothetical protein